MREESQLAERLSYGGDVRCGGGLLPDGSRPRARDKRRLFADRQNWRAEPFILAADPPDNEPARVQANFFVSRF